MTIHMHRRGVVANLVAAVAATALPATVRSQSRIAMAAKHHQVEISRFKFIPAILDVSPGDTITWTNRDIAPHTATARDRSWDTGTIAKNQSASIVVEPGMAGSYVCRFHPVMKAAIKITVSQ